MKKRGDETDRVSVINAGFFMWKRFVYACKNPDAIIYVISGYAAPLPG
jgi:hypothetical protein